MGVEVLWLVVYFGGVVSVLSEFETDVTQLVCAGTAGAFTSSSTVVSASRGMPMVEHDITSVSQQQSSDGSSPLLGHDITSVSQKLSSSSSGPPRAASSSESLSLEPHPVSVQN